jgi:hypothetical protein
MGPPWWENEGSKKRLATSKFELGTTKLRNLKIQKKTEMRKTRSEKVTSLRGEQFFGDRTSVAKKSQKNNK